jgi:hypothetical protein
MEVMDCELRRKLARELSEAIRTMTTKPRTELLEVLEARRSCARKAYWTHMAEHECDDPARRLNGIIPLK